MGFLDKLLGRDKEATESTSQVTGEEEAPVATEAAESSAEPEAAEESDVTQSEQRLDNIRDQALRDQGRMP